MATPHYANKKNILINNYLNRKFTKIYTVVYQLLYLPHIHSKNQLKLIMNNSVNNQLSCPISLLKDNYRLSDKSTKGLPECGNGSISKNSIFFKSTPPPSKYFYPKIFKILQIVSIKPDKTPVQGLNLVTFSSKSSNIFQTLKTCCFVFHSENPNNKALQTRALLS